MIKTSTHDTVETKNVLNINMSLAPRRHRIIGPCGEKKKCLKKCKNATITTIWDLETDLLIQNIGYFASTRLAGFVFERSSEVSYTTSIAALLSTKII